jgi:hypothetical protein
VANPILRVGRGPLTGPATAQTLQPNEVSNLMSDNNEAKIQRWERYIEECRREAKLLSPEGKITMQSVIDSYERLIAMVRGKGKKG